MKQVAKLQEILSITMFLFLNVRLEKISCTQIWKRQDNIICKITIAQIGLI